MWTVQLRSSGSREPGTKDIMKTLRTEDASFVDFILCFLQWDPADRITPNEAMRHPWIAECFQQDTIERTAQSQSGASHQRPRLNSARPAQQQQPQLQQLNAGKPGLPSIDTVSSGTIVSSSKSAVTAWRLNRKIGSAHTSRRPSLPGANSSDV